MVREKKKMRIAHLKKENSGGTDKEEPANRASWYEWEIPFIDLR